MKNLRKILALVLAVVMTVSTLTVAFAAETKTSGEKLKTLGLIQGNEDGDLMEDKTITRAEAAEILVKVMGWELEPASAYTFTDATWAKAQAATLVKQGITKGIGNNQFGGAVLMDELQVYAWAYAALTKDQNSAWDNPQLLKAFLDGDKVVQITVASAKDVKAKRSDIFDGMITILTKEVDGVTQLDKLVKAGKVTEKQVIEAGLEKTVVEADLKVESVKALNLKQIQVTFNKDAKVTRANFLVNGRTLATSGEFALSADGTIATLWVNDAVAVPAGQKIKVTLVDVDGLATTLVDVVMNDNDGVPFVKSVEAVGNRLVKVTYSEPISAGATARTNYRLNGAIINGQPSIVPNTMNTVVHINMNTTLADATYKLSVAASAIVDYASRNIGVNETEFTVAKDSALPGHTIVYATPELVIVKFDREVLGHNGTHGSTTADMRITVKVNGTDQKITGTTLNNKDFYFDFSGSSFANRLSVGENSLTIAKVVDYSGNSGAVTIKPEVVVDQTRPVFESFTQVETNVFEVKFSKETATPLGSWFALTDKENQVVTINNSDVSHKFENGAPDHTVIVINKSGLKLDRNPYTLKIQNVIDRTYLANKAQDAIVKFDFKNFEGPSIISATKTNNTISIMFDKDIDFASVSLANFRYLSGGTTAYSLPSAAYMEAVGNRTINITFPNIWSSLNHTIGNVQSLYVAGVKDTVAIEMLAATQSITSVTAGQVVAGDIYASDAKTLVFKTSHALASVYEGDFVVKAGTGLATDDVLEIDKVEIVKADVDVNKYALHSDGNDLTDGTGLANIDNIDDGDYIVVIKLKASLNLDGSYGTLRKPVYVSTASTVEATKTASGVALSITDATIEDRIIPEAPVASNFAYNNLETATITIVNPFVFDENVTIEYTVQPRLTEVNEATTADAYAYDDVGNTGNALVGRTYTSALDGDLETISVALGSKIYFRTIDAAGNFSAWVAIDERVKPATTAVLAKGTNAGTTKLTAVTDTMEYRVNNGNWTSVPTAATVVDNIAVLANDVIQVREKQLANNTQAVGKIQAIVVLAGDIQ